MSKKNSIKKTAALLLGLALTVGATGCDFISTDSVKDLQQTVATVNISSLIAEKDDLQNAETLAADLNKIIDLGGVSKDIPKRDLVSYFMSVGYTYVQSYGYSYTDTFNMILDMLVSRKIVTQYAVVYYLSKGLTVEGNDGCKKFIENDKPENPQSEKERELLAAHPEVSALKYFLTENGTKNDLYNKVLYQMKSSINSSLDSSEQNYINETEEEHDHGTPRTTPTGVDTEKEDFYIDCLGEVSRYDVYTGFNKNGVPYGYEALDGSNQNTRRKAYNAFVGNLDDNGLLKKTDNPTVFSEMDYYYVELASRLEQALIEKYTDDLIAEGDNELLGTTNQAAYLKDRYAQTNSAQKVAYDADTTAYETALNGLSDTNFVTYAPNLGEGFNYGFVYNILLPFSEEQNRLYSAEEARSTDELELYGYRAKLLSEVKGKDLRDSWFSAHDHANYAFDAAEAGVDYYANGGSNYIFFENNLTNNERYEKLNVYLGQYPFNGSVSKNEDGEFTLKATALGIDEFLGEMESYFEYAVGTGSVTKPFASTDNTAKQATDANGYWNEYKKNGAYVNLEEDGKTFTDYSEFIYYAGKVNVGNSTPANYFNPETAGYKAAAAFNELMFAYSTDTGCLNTYMGYLVSPITTSFVPEFEYAAQWAIKQGAGTYVVCPSTYGWHIIYVTTVFSGSDVYGGYNEAEADTEGTFSYMYKEALKAEYSSQYANKEQTRLILEYDNDSCVSRIQAAYQDLLDLDK